MENNRIKESISAVNQSLGIDLEVIVNDAQLESQKKFETHLRESVNRITYQMDAERYEKVNSAYRRTSV